MRRAQFFAVQELPVGVDERTLRREQAVNLPQEVLAQFARGDVVQDGKGRDR